MKTRHITIIVLAMVVLGTTSGIAQYRPSFTRLEQAPTAPREPQPAASGYSKSENPNDMTIELLGRCGLYSLSYQLTLFNHVGIEIGGALYGGSGANLLLLSAGGRLYLLPGNASPCIGAGIVAATANIDVGPFDDSASGYYGYLTPGFEYRSSGGFLFRGNINVLLNDGFLVWPGFQIGIAF